MKLQPDPIDTHNPIRGYTPSSVTVGERTWHESLVLPWQGELAPWAAASFDALTAAHFDRLGEWQPEIVLFGSGHRLRFARASWLAGLTRQRIGVETMDMAAACRTYNLLAAEGRKVVAALLIERA